MSPGHIKFCTRHNDPTDCQFLLSQNRWQILLAMDDYLRSRVRAATDDGVWMAPVNLQSPFDHARAHGCRGTVCHRSLAAWKNLAWDLCLGEPHQPFIFSRRYGGPIPCSCPILCSWSILYWW